jgi:adenylate cyclase
MRWATRRSRRESRLRRASLLAIGAGLLFMAWAIFFNPLRSLQNLIADSLFVEGPGSSNIAIVAIDDDSLDRYGRLGEWPRSLHATAIQKLHEAGARVIVYDVLFADEGEGDEALAQAMLAADDVVLPVAGTASTPTQGASIYLYETFALPVDTLRRAAASLGHANLVTDSDGRVRRMPLAVGGVGGEQYPALSLAAFYLQFGRRPPPALETRGDALPLLGRNVPLEGFQTMRINYIGGQGSFAHIPFNDVVGGSFDESLVRGKAVFVGLTAAGADTHSTPLIGGADGVEIHANSLDTLLRARFLQPTDDTVTLVTALLFVVAAGLALPRWRLTHAAAFVLVPIVAYPAVVIAYVVFGAFTFRQGHILDFVDPPAALAVTMIAALVYRVVTERAAQQEVTELFGRYVSPEIAHELMQRSDQGELQLGGELREVTALFADIRGFTTLSETMTPSQLVALLNCLFEVIISNICKNGGIVNKFLGDAVVAFWNAPRQQPDHALMACQAAIAAQAELEVLAPSGPAAKFGFGINTGSVLAGNVGTAGRLEYTVIGEAVNTAARLSQAAGGGEIWIGEGTYKLVEGRIEAEELPPQYLKGMAGPATVYRLKPEATEALPQVREVLR